MTIKDVKHDLATIMDAWTATVASVLFAFKLFLTDKLSLVGVNELMDGTTGIITWFIALFTMIWAFFRAVESIIDNVTKFRKWLSQIRQKK